MNKIFDTVGIEGFDIEPDESLCWEYDELKRNSRIDQISNHGGITEDSIISF